MTAVITKRTGDLAFSNASGIGKAPGKPDVIALGWLGCKAE